MRLTMFSDYSIRLLITVASADGRPVTITNAARSLHISRNHLVKVASNLTHNGVLSGARGRSGGLTLKKQPSEIRIGELLRMTEPDFNLAVCFSAPGSCSLEAICGLPRFLNQALAAFMDELNKYTLADILPRHGNTPTPFE